MAQRQLYLQCNVITYLIDKNVYVYPLMKQFNDKCSIDKKQGLNIFAYNEKRIENGIERYLLLFPELLGVPLNKTIQPASKTKSTLLSLLIKNKELFDNTVLSETEDSFLFTIYGDDPINDTGCELSICKEANKSTGVCEYSIVVTINGISSIEKHSTFPTIISLYSEHSGQISDFCEELILERWQEFYQVLSIDSPYAKKWINLLLDATYKHDIIWKNSTTFYKNYKIAVSMRYSYESVQDVKFLTLYIHKEGDLLCNRISILEKESHGTPLETLYLAMIKNMQDNSPRRLPEEQIQISHADILIRTFSLTCKSENHTILPKTGFIKILTDKGETINQSVYVGYCTSCNVYFIFQDDFEKVAQMGTLLCRVYDYRTWTRLSNIKKGSFDYMRESVLKAYGYNVSSQNNLSDLRRYAILQSIIEGYIMDTNRIIEFLNWLIRTHSNQENYQDAVYKWKNDLRFVKNLAKDEREQVNISSITVK